MYSVTFNRFSLSLEVVQRLVRDTVSATVCYAATQQHLPSFLREDSIAYRFRCIKNECRSSVSRRRTFPLLRNFWVNSFEFLCRSDWRLMLNSFTSSLLLREFCQIGGEKESTVIVLRFWQLRHSSFSSGLANKLVADFSLLSEHIIYKIIAEKLYAN